MTRFATTLQAVSTEQVQPADGVTELLTALEAASVPMAVVTNDSEGFARAQMDSLQWAHRFEVILGADSGYGGKPDPGMVTQGCAQLGVDARSSWMIGDSIHDMLAGRAAGCRTLLVTNGGKSTGAAGHADLTVETLATITLDHLNL